MRRIRIKSPFRKRPAPESRQRRIISRIATLTLGVAILFVAAKGLGWHSQHERDRPIASRTVLVLALVLLAPGAICTTVALIPSRWLYRIGPNDVPDLDARTAVELLETLK